MISASNNKGGKREALDRYVTTNVLSFLTGNQNKKQTNLLKQVIFESVKMNLAGSIEIRNKPRFSF